MWVGAHVRLLVPSLSGVRLLVLADNSLVGASAASAGAGPVPAAVGVCSLGGWGTRAGLANDGFSGPPLYLGGPLSPDPRPDGAAANANNGGGSSASSGGSSGGLATGGAESDDDTDPSSSSSSSSGVAAPLASGAGGAAARALGGDGLATLLAVLSRSNGALEALSLCDLA